MLLQQLTLSQLQEWEAYDKIDPLGEERMDLRFAMLESLIMNLFLSVFGKEGTQLTTPKEFLPRFYVNLEEEKGKSIKKIKDMLMTFADNPEEKEK